MRTALSLLLCLFLSLASVPAHSFDYEVAFSPRGQSLQLVLKTIQSAQKSIRVAAYSFTSKPVAMALVAAEKRGVDVKVVADQKANSGKYTAVTFLANQGIPVKLNGNYPIMHHKFILVDGRHLQTGSFNYSAAAANKNAENVLVLHDMPDMVEQYQAEWGQLWDEGTDLTAAY